MTRFLSVLAWIMVPYLACAGEKHAPNTLTEKEIRDGWILLFDGVTTFGWKTEGEVKVQEGVITLGGTKAASIETTTSFGYCDLSFEFTRNGTPRFEGAGYSLPFLGEDRLQWVTCDGSFPPNKFKEPAWIFSHPSWKGSTAYDRKPDTIAELKQFRLEVPAGSSLEIRSVKLRPGDTQPIFNGKDLAGWKVFPGEKYKSRYTVTPEGWLNVKNGPGDLQTEKQYADFVLQLECISNGKMLNSGIFFRCLADQYQKGYEAQIQNGYKDQDRTKPIDFGTGAIYRRAAARKVVPNDHEWFSMTVMARGKRFATWVNGYQVVDWSDDRKESDNARDGCKVGKGHLSIQGHDPTTDLSFRNLRVGELAGK